MASNSFNLSDLEELSVRNVFLKSENLKKNNDLEDMLCWINLTYNEIEKILHLKKMVQTYVYKWYLKVFIILWINIIFYQSFIKVTLDNFIWGNFLKTEPNSAVLRFSKTSFFDTVFEFRKLENVPGKKPLLARNQ